MKRRDGRKALVTGTALAALMLLGGCGGGGGVASTPTPPTAPPPAPPPPPPPPPPPATGFDTTEYRSSNGAVQANALSAYQAGATGQGITVAVIDSGVAAGNAEFAGKIHPASADLASNRGVGDDGGHGTAVSAILLGAKNESSTHGVAFNATLLVARTDTPGTCSSTDPSEGCSHNDNTIARGVDLAIANNARVINISLGGSPANSTLRAAIGRAAAAGIVIVISAGNEGVTDPTAAVNPDPLAQIANDPVARGLVIIAGGLDSTNAQLASFSNRAGNSQAHYVAALGSRLLSIDETGALFRFSGTSFSAPVISGAVALLAQAVPNLSGAQIKELILTSAVDLGATGVDAQFGYGALDIASAFQPRGSASLAGSAIPVSLGALGTASNAMGDGGQTGSSVVILDAYGRAYDVALGGRLRAPAASNRLAQALTVDGSQTLFAATDRTAFSVSVAGARRGAFAERMLLSPRDSASARALAGSIVARLGPKTAIALGVSQSGVALARDLEGRAGAGFIGIRETVSDTGFDARAGNGFALAHQLGGVTVSFAAENGTVRIWEDAIADRVRPGWEGHRYSALRFGASKRFGAIDAAFAATWLDERDTVLGADLGAIFSRNGAQSSFADARLGWNAGAKLRFEAAWRQGWTRVAGGALHPGVDWLTSNAWSIGATRRGVFGDDSVAFRIAQPLRLSRGGLRLTLPIGYDYATQQASIGAGQIDLSPTGRETDFEAVYSRALGRGRLSANGYLRTEPGHVQAAPDDLGVALRFTMGF